VKYADISAEIEAAILRGDLGPGDRLPPERALAEQHGVSRMTVRQALQTLESRGLLERAIGRNGGSFVARPKLERDLGTFGGLSAQLARQGVRAGARVLSAGEADGGGIEIVRVRFADDEPFALERSWFPERFSGLLSLDLTGSLYELLGDDAPVRAVERLEPVVADGDESAVLGVRPGAPLMLVHREAFDGAGELVERARDLFRGDRTRIVAWTSELVRA
jgi:GntR family transcriptional regulator